MVTATGIYFIKIDAKSGNVVSITQEEKAESTLTEEKTKKLLTENEVLEKISSQGEVNSIEYIQDKKSSYYQAIVEKGNEELTLTIDPFTGGITHSAKTSLRLLNESDAVDLALKRVN